MTYLGSSFLAWLTDIRDGFAALRPGHFLDTRFAFALALGICGGLLFQHLALPLPWMMGPMVFCTLAALLKAPVAAPPVIKAAHDDGHRRDARLGL
jgi:uncharacterized protein